jgi:hypothetical protein
VGKTRFTVEVDGFNRELFSLSEKKDGDIMLFIKSAREIATSSGGTHEAVGEQRFSVHVSPKSIGHTLKQTLRTRSGVTTTSALVLPRRYLEKTASGLVVGPAQQFCWPIFMYRPPILDLDRYDSKPKPADRKIDIGSMNPNLSSLVYMVVATSPDVTEIPQTRNRTFSHTVKCRVFNIHVVIGYSLAPSIPQGEFLTFVTSTMQQSWTPSKIVRSPRTSHQPSIIEAEFFRGFGLLRDKYASDFAELDQSSDSFNKNSLPLSSLMRILAAICVDKSPFSAEESIKAYDDYQLSIASAKGEIRDNASEARAALSSLIEVLGRSRVFGGRDKPPLT